MKIQQWLFELLRKQSVTDGRTDGRTDNMKTVYPLQTKFAGGITNKIYQMDFMINTVKSSSILTFKVLW